MKNFDIIKEISALINENNRLKEQINLLKNELEYQKIKTNDYEFENNAESDWLFHYNKTLEQMEVKDLDLLAWELGQKVARDKYDNLCNRAVYRMKRKKCIYCSDLSLYNDFGMTIHCSGDYYFGDTTSQIYKICHKLVKDLSINEQRFLWIFRNTNPSIYNIDYYYSEEDVFNDICDELYNMLYDYLDQDDRF